jgi:hypothetical protein
MGAEFFHYDKIALAELLIGRTQGDNHLFMSTYLEFVKRFFGPGSQFVSPAIRFLTDVKDDKFKELMEMLRNTVDELERQTKIQSSLPPVKVGETHSITIEEVQPSGTAFDKPKIVKNDKGEIKGYNAYGKLLESNTTWEDYKVFV